MRTVSIALTRELEQLVEKKVKSGLYPTATDVIHEGLRLLDERDRLYQTRLKELRREIHKGVASGPATPFNSASLKKKVRHALSRQLKA